MAKKSIPVATPAPSNDADDNANADIIVSLRDRAPLKYYEDQWEGVLMPDGFRRQLADIDACLDTADTLHDMITLDDAHSEDKRENGVQYQELLPSHRHALVQATRLLLQTARNDLEDIRERGLQAAEQQP